MQKVCDPTERVAMESSITGKSSTYTPIEDHGVIGNMHTVALVTRTASINWYCYPDFDSPSVFTSILDYEKGGFFSLRNVSDCDVALKQLYHPETNILVTRFLSVDGVAQTVDLMPVGCDDIIKSQGGTPAKGWIVRRIECVRGRMSFEVNCCPRFNYAKETPNTHIISHYSVMFRSPTLTMVLHSSTKINWKPSQTIEGGIIGTLCVVEDEHETIVFREYIPNVDEKRLLQPFSNAIADLLRRDTLNYWRKWIAKCNYCGRWREIVYRSALALKLLTYQPTGAIIAAPTTSLPEAICGPRNWDYRYTWIRDSSFTLYVFLRLGFTEEAVSFMKWVEKRNELTPDGGLQIMYGIRGEHCLQEVELSHLEGYKKSTPVRIGNGAFDQLQIDIYGELMDSCYISNKYAAPISYSLWSHLRKLVDHVCKIWMLPDEGIWEVRGGKRHFVYSKVMSWVAIDRGIRLAEKRSFPADVSRWRSVRDTIYEEVQEKGWSEERQAYVQSYGSNTLDASILIMPLVFFSSPNDERFVSTLEAIMKSVKDGGLVSNNLVFRYDTEKTNDGLSGDEGTFSICSFWAVEALARVGQYRPEYVERARTMFEQMLGYASLHGLYSEQIGHHGESLGNFPQAFTHLALISAAHRLNMMLN